MSNERIDLKQFESEEEWDLTGFDWLAKQADSEYVANAVRQVPELIAELKRRYEEIDELKELCNEFMGQALTLYDVGNQHKDVDFDYREFNKLRARFAELLDYGGHKTSK